MRLDDRAIRDALRQEAASVTPPADLWDRIDRELNSGSAQPPRAVSAPRRTALRVRHFIAAGAAAGVFWMFVLPAGVPWKDAETLESRPGAAQLAAPAEPAPAAAEPSAGRPSHGGRRHAPVKAASGLQWPSQEIALVR